MFQEEPQNWRELLGQIVSDQAEMQRIVQELGVRDITVKRWVSGVSEPRMQNLRGLLSALPEYRERFLEYFSEAFEGFTDLPFDASFQEIPAQFYAQIFHTQGTINHTQRYWSTANMIISQALIQLDPENLGLAVTVVKCMKSDRHNKVYSLRQSVGQATSPWPGNLEQKAMFLGAESLAGYVVSTCHPFEVNNFREDPHALPGHQFEFEQSAAAHPILYAGRIAGCLLVSSTEQHYFLQPSRMKQIADYAHLMALAFDPEEFVYPEELELHIMPSHAEQKAAFSSFRQRITAAKLKLYETKSDRDAEQYVWEELESELLEQQRQKYLDEQNER